MNIFGPSTKSLGRLEPIDVERAIVFTERKQNDCMPAQWGRRKPISFLAERWITNYRDLPVEKAKLPRP